MALIPQIYIRRMRFDEARNKLLSDIEHHFFAGQSEVEIIHGIGNYVLRKMVIAELGKLDYVRFEDAGFHPNPGSLKVRLMVPDPGLMQLYRG